MPGLDVAKTADLFGQFGKGQGVSGGIGVEPFDQGADGGLVAGNQCAFLAAFFGVAKGVKGGATQHFERRQQLEAPGHTGTKLLLLQLALVVLFGQQGRRQVVMHLVVALEHCTDFFAKRRVFPHANDPSPIYGFDIVAGPNKVSGAFHDFSAAGETNHSMLAWFADQTATLEWNKKRELPEWAKNIFSSSMVAIGAVGEKELDEFVNLGLKTLDYYLENVGLTQESLADYHMAQNRYCRYQKQNPHTPRVLVTLGFTEQQAREFVEQTLFPEIG